MARSWVYKIGGSGTLLTKEEMDNNILCIFGVLSSYGFTRQAIAGACGCFYAESGFNPAIYETSHGGNLQHLPYFPGGMGLAQWTDYPAYESRYPNPLAWSAFKENKNWYDGSFQCWLMNKADDSNYTSMGFGQGPRWGWQQSTSYESISFNAYKVFGGTPEQACRYWFFDLEWHASEAQAIAQLGADAIPLRQRWARYAYDIIEGREPELPNPNSPNAPINPDDPMKPIKGLPVWMMLKPWYK